MLKRAFVVGSALALSGCANWNTVYHEVSGSPDRQRSIVVDATQRSVVSVKKPALDASGVAIKYSNNEPVFSTVVCPEPYPDALAAFFASGAFTAGITSADTSAKQIQAALATGSAVASFGLRTNSTVLLTNSISSNCFAFMNGATNNPGYMELQRRSQTFNLGILAIEQLTGVVKGDQASAGSVAGAGTGSPDTSGLQKEVDAARKDQVNAASDLAEAEKKRNDKADEVNKQSAVQQAAATKLAAATNDADKAAAQEDLTKQSEALDTLQGELTKLEDALTTATGANTEARRRLSQTIAALQAAQLNARASGSASGSNALNRDVLAAATPAVAQAVSQIVLSVLLEAGRGEECNGIIADFPKHPDVYQSGPGLSLLNACVADRKLTRDALQRNLLGR